MFDNEYTIVHFAEEHLQAGARATGNELPAVRLLMVIDAEAYIPDEQQSLALRATIKLRAKMRTAMEAVRPFRAAGQEIDPAIQAQLDIWQNQYETLAPGTQLGVMVTARTTSSRPLASLP